MMWWDYLVNYIGNSITDVVHCLHGFADNEITNGNEL